MANGGWETFLSYEDPEQDILVGLLRLRKCSEESFRPELKGGVSIVRELHVYGSVVPVSSRDPSKFQHQVDQEIVTSVRVLSSPRLWSGRKKKMSIFELPGSNQFGYFAHNLLQHNQDLNLFSILSLIGKNPATTEFCLDGPNRGYITIEGVWLYFTGIAVCLSSIGSWY